MTMSSSVSKVTLNGDGVQTSFPFSFKVWKAADLEISITNAEGVTTVVSNWSVSLAGQGGTVTYPTSGPALPSGHKITIARSMDFLQDVDLVSGTRWDPEVVETALDQATAERQQLREKLDRAITVDIASGTTPEALRDAIFAAQESAAASASAAATSASEAEIAASSVGFISASGTLLAGNDTIVLPFEYNFEAGAVAIYLGGVKQEKGTLTFVDSTHVKVGAAVAVDTVWEAVSVVQSGEGVLTALRDQCITAKIAAELAETNAETAETNAELAQAAAEAARDVILGSVASETVAGIVELATTTEASTGTDTSRAVTAAGVDAYHKAKNINLGVSVPASGTAVDFVGIPEGVKRITVILDGVSTNGTSLLLLLVGTSGGFITSGYISNRGVINNTSVFVINNTTGFDIASPASAAVLQKGDIVLSTYAGNKWEARGVLADGVSQVSITTGKVGLPDALDRIRITTVNGTDQFDAGTINISWEF